jgi:quercetin dioxygenase-like cupin family protein
LLIFKAGGSTSMHHHLRKLETMYLQSGKVLIRFENHTIGLEPGEKIQIQRGQKHQIVAIEDSELFECSTQDFWDDSIREI